MSGKPGRKPGIPLFRHQVMLDRETVFDARAIGDGNLSRGVREAVRLAREKREREADNEDQSE